ARAGSHRAPPCATRDDRRRGRTRQSRAVEPGLHARSGSLSAFMRVCLVYDCLYPFTVGGAERWYRNLAERLAADGHKVTYLTLRQWDRGATPELDGVRVVAVGPRMALYTDDRRRILPPLVFGLGVLWHLLRHGL